MKNYVIVLAVFGMMAASIWAGPQLTLKEEEFNFGIIPQNAKVSHTFWIYSTGDEDLHISKVVPGCGCTKAPLEKDVLAPGDSTRLEIIFSSGHYTRHVSKQPRIESNAENPNQLVKIVSDVTDHPEKAEPIYARPYKLNLSQYGTQVRDGMSFRLHNASDQDLAVKVISMPEEIGKYDFPDKIKAGGSAIANIKLTDEALDSEWTKSITLEADDEYKTRLTIPVVREIQQPKATPASATVEEKADE